MGFTGLLQVCIPNSLFTAGCSVALSILRAALRLHFYLFPQLSGAAVKAECEGLAGRALRSVATQMAKDTECRQTVDAFEALSDNPQEGTWKQQPQSVPDAPDGSGGGNDDCGVVAAEVKNCDL